MAVGATSAWTSFAKEVAECDHCAGLEQKTHNSIRHGGVQEDVAVALARGQKNVTALFAAFAQRQQVHLSQQLSALHEALAATHLETVDSVLALANLSSPSSTANWQSSDEEEQLAAIPSEPHVHFGRAGTCTGTASQDAFQDLPILLKQPSLNMQHSEKPGDGELRLPVAPARSPTEETFASPGHSRWAPSKEATQDAFNRLVEKVDGSSMGLNKALKRALRRSGLDLDQLSTPQVRFPRLLKFVKSTRFVCIIMMLIVSNAIFICFLADDHAHRAAKEYENVVTGRTSSLQLPAWQQTVEMTFTGIFILELFLRMVAEEWSFWIGSDWKWNLFDTILVMTMIADTALVLAGLDISYIRLLRVLRALRTVRIIRVLRFFRELRVMLLSIMNSIAPLMWAVLFLALTISVFSVVFLQGVTNFILDAKMESEKVEAVQEFYSSFPMASFSLFMAITGGNDWWLLVRPLLEISPVYAVLFVVYIFLMVLGVLNIITGIFVESATELSRLDRDLVTQAEQERTGTYMKELRKLFLEIDSDRNGVISLEEFEDFAANDEVQAYFSVLELDVTKATQVFRLLDIDRSNQIEIDEFVVGCMRLKGLAKGVDMESLMLENKRMMTRWNNHQKWTRRQFSTIEELIASSCRENHTAIQSMKSMVSQLMTTLPNNKHTGL
mmetsp:Transcript_44515/g.79978  ORF Transcript_44515/g.79978 Transcript_44515/m.79978 type:complete len:671 (+) Transcript_44515:99-2111(+)